MSLMTCEQIELSVWKEVASRHLSVSHDRWHLDRVLSFARQLQAIYGGALEVIVAAVLLHDLGRSDSELHGQASIERSIKDAKEILAGIGLPPSKIEQVLLAINEHDKPEIRPSTIEGRILKDADFLGGFGAWGVLRITMWAGETGSGVSQVLDRLERRMLKRMASLEFPESERLAKEEMLFTSLFLSRLNRPPRLSDRQIEGTYIVLEGISGSGKDTQADLLQTRLEGMGHKIVRAKEPAGKYQQMRDLWEGSVSDPVIQLFLLLADRYEQVRNTIKPTLIRGDTVLSVRSFMSALVYQHNDVYVLEEMSFFHHFVPLPDLLILLDLDADIAYERCSIRATQTVQEMSSHEEREKLENHRQRYLDLVHNLPILETVIIDASKSIEEVGAQVWQIVQERFL